MSAKFGSNSKAKTFSRIMLWALVLAISSGLASCGSTKVYTADKTVVYRESIYNVSNVSVFTRRIDGVISADKTVDLGNVDKKGFNDLIKQHGEIFVRQVFLLDDKELVYQARGVASWSDYNRMAKKFDGASKDLRKFLADKKKTQLRLG